MGDGDVLLGEDQGRLSRVRATLRCRHGHRDLPALVLRPRGSNIKIPKALDAAFLDAPISDGITSAIADYQRHRAAELEAELFAQRTRLAAAEHKVQVKFTKAASEDVRIATSKIDSATRGLDDLRRRELLERDSRIFPGWLRPC
nr:hypothetical protein [Burkholderia ubonensis]